MNRWPRKLISLGVLLAGPAPGRAADEVPLPTTQPAGPELARRVTATLLDLNEAMRRNDFGPFHARAAAPLAAKASAADLRRAFDDLIRQRVDLSPVKDVPPVFDAPPDLNDAGVWSVKGRFPTTPCAVRFAVQYFAEQGEWKVLALDVAVDKIPPPPAGEVRALARRTLADFAAAVRANNFTEFGAAGSSAFREQYPPGELLKQFAGLAGKSLDLTPPPGEALTFDAAPALAAGPALVIAGHYPAGPVAVRFKLTYARAEGEWKLAGIEVNVRQVR